MQVNKPSNLLFSASFVTSALADQVALNTFHVLSPQKKKFQTGFKIH